MSGSDDSGDRDSGSDNNGNNISQGGISGDDDMTVITKRVDVMKWW